MKWVLVKCLIILMNFIITQMWLSTVSTIWKENNEVHRRYCCSCELAFEVVVAHFQNSLLALSHCHSNMSQWLNSIGSASNGAEPIVLIALVIPCKLAITGVQIVFFSFRFALLYIPFSRKGNLFPQ